MFEITIRTIDGAGVRVEAERINEFLAVHRPCPARVGDCWDLSHIHSGRRLGRFVTFRAARRFALVATEEFAQLTCAEPDLHAEERSHFLNLLRMHGGVMIRPKEKR